MHLEVEQNESHHLNNHVNQHKDRPMMILFYNIMAISSLSIAGVASRIALLRTVMHSSFFPQAITITVNVLGSFMMGFLVHCNGFDSAYPYIYTGLTVGFCGSFTTFSSWMYSIIHNGYALIDMGTGLSIPFVAFTIGHDIGQNFSVKKSINSLNFDKIMVFIVALAAFLTLVIVGTSKTTVSTHTITDADVISCALGPIGALTRWILCKELNNKILASPDKQTFRFGTLSSNFIAVIITGALQKYASGNFWTVCVITGICGSLSTVSSWVNDTVSIYEKVSKKWAYFYCSISVFICVIVILMFNI